MASRIHTLFSFMTTGAPRCHNMNGFSYGVIRWHRDSLNNNIIEPIIAKGNRFDGVEAVY